MVPFRKHLIFFNQGKPAIKQGGHFYTALLDILMLCRGHTAPTNLPLWMERGQFWFIYCAVYHLKLNCLSCIGF